METLLLDNIIRFDQLVQFKLESHDQGMVHEKIYI
jgi:hypothetical protein